MTQSNDWSRVWEAAEQARIDLGWTKAEMYARAAIGETTYAKLREGEPLRRADKRHTFATAFGWTVADLDAIAAGDAAPPSVEAPEVTPSLLAELRSEVGLLREMVLSLANRVDRLTPC